MSPAELIIQLFNQMTPLVVGRGRKTLLSLQSAKTLNDAEALYFWCDKRSIIPGAYLASCFAKHSWAYRPQLERLSLKVYEAYFENNREDAYLWWATIQRDWQAHEPVDLPVGKEIIKKRFLATGGPIKCIARPEMSGGYNKLSKLCQKCDMQQECHDF